jgi:tetratricopeptide (TPR) repeat protein
MKEKLLSVLFLVAVATTAFADARDQEMRDRYEKVLMKNPFQERAFNEVYDGYSKVEGIDKWIEALKPKTNSEDGLSAMLLLGQIYDRQFKLTNAISAFESAAAKGEARPQFKVMLGTLYYKAGDDEKAAKMLSAGLDTLTDLDQRSSVCRILGNIYLRQGKRDQATESWKRITEQNPNEIFSQLELGEIYEDNRMWTNAIAVYQHIAEVAKEDPYRRCRALRSVGQCQVQQEKFTDAIATYEQALGLVSPGNWLFEDLKLRLVGVYEDIGDLAGLIKYVNSRLEQNPGDVEFRDLLAETYSRMSKFDEADKQFKAILGRNPRSTATYEKMLALYTGTGRTNDVVATFEKLIELSPADTDYVRRLGEYYLRANQADKAKETWRRIAQGGASGEKLATLAGWFENFEFADDAIAAYQQAVALNKNKDWVERLAALKFSKGEEAEAVKLWLSIIDDKSKVEDYAEVASILEANQKVDEAAKLRKAAVQKDASNLDSHLALGKTLMRQKKYEEAAAEFEVLASQDKSEFMMLQGESGRLDAWRELNVLADRQKDWEKEVDAHPENEKALAQLARLYERSGQKEKAIALYEHRRQADQNNIEHLRSLAGLYKSAKLNEQAIETFKTLLEKDKNRARVYQKELLDVYLALDLKDEAIGTAEQIISLAPSDPEARLMLAQVYAQYRQTEKALGEYRYALRLEPNEPDYYRQYGDALSAEQRYGEAQEAYRKMLDVAKEDSTRLGAVGNLSRIYLQQSQLDDLISEFSRRVRNTPKKLAAYEELAAIYKESGQIFKSVEVLENGLQNVDDRAAALKSLIRVGYEAQDFEKVKNYYEQLVAMSGKPTAQEYERLGEIYATIGDLEKAKATWNKIIADAPKDPKAADRVSGLLRKQGLTDEAIAIKAKAVEMDPTDFKRRFDYAELLAQSEQQVEALKQMRMILDLGETSEQQKKDEEEKEKKVKQVGRKGPYRQMIGYGFMYGSRNYGRYYGTPSWQGSFAEFRPMLLQYMASVAQQSVGEDTFIEQFKQRVKKQPANLDLKRDLMTVLQNYNRIEDALKVAEELVAAAPDDSELQMQTALFYSDQQKIDKSIALLEKLVATQPKLRVQAAQGLIPLYFKNKQETNGVQLAHKILDDNPTDVSMCYMIANLLQQNGKYDLAKRAFERAIAIDPAYRANVQYSLAQLAKQQGHMEDANAIYEKALLDDGSTGRRSIYSYRPRVDIYVPQTGPTSRSYGNPFQNLPQNVVGSIDYSKSEALRTLKTAQTNNILDKLREVGATYKTGALPSAKNRAWEASRLLIANYLVDKEWDKAADVLATLKAGGMDDVEWYNASLYVAQQKEDYAKMLSLYDALLQKLPAKARDIAIAKATTSIIGKRYNDAVKTIRDLNQQRVPPGMVLGLIHQLISAGEKGKAKKLLIEHLSGVSRTSDGLATLAKLYAEDNDTEKAIALANEAWERKAHGRQSSSGYYGFYYQPYYSAYGRTDSLLNDLHKYYVSAGKSEELIKRFQERLEKQPGSVQAHEDLAMLYRLSNQRDKALELYQSLATKRPHLMQVRRTIAQLYTESGEFNKATELFEQLIKDNPALYEQLQWELRSLYQRMGKGKELAKMEEKMVVKATNPNQLYNLAWQMKENGELDKAIELYRKAVKLSPGQSYMQSQLAECLVLDGQLDEATKLFRDWLDAPTTRTQGWVDYSMLKSLTGLFRATGKLEELKTRCDTELKKNPNDVVSQALLAQIAMFDKHFDDALARFKVVVESGRDPNILNELIELANLTGRVDDVLKLSEKTDKSQNTWQLENLGRLYLIKGETKKGEDMVLQWADEQLNNGNSSWAMQQTVDVLSQFDRWESVEKFVRKHRTDSQLQQYEADEIDRKIADGYVGNQRFKGIVDEVLQKPQLKGRDLDLVRKLSDKLQSSGKSADRRALLEKLVAGDPKNHALAFQLANLYDNDTESEKKIALLKKLVKANGNNLQHRDALTAAMIAAGRGDEALTSFTAWVNQKPSEARYAALAKHQKDLGLFKDARASLEKAVEVADTSKKEERRIALADFDAERGEPEVRKKALRQNFEKRKSSDSFQRYLNFLTSQGYDEEATQFLTANYQKGFLDSYRGNDVVDIWLDASDYKDAIEHCWQFTRYSERWNRDQSFDNGLKAFRNRGKAGLFLDEMRKRIETETPRHRGLLSKLAKSYSECGYDEQALAVYDRLLKLSRFNQEAVLAKANLLMKMKRNDEAIALLRDPSGVTTLEEELQSSYRLIAALFKLKRFDEADAEVKKVLDWSKGANAYSELGDAYVKAGLYEKALPLLEKARSLQHGDGYYNTLESIAKCYAYSKRDTDALAVFHELVRRPSLNADQLGNLQSWLLNHGYAALSAQLGQERIANRSRANGLVYATATALLRAGRLDEAIALYNKGYDSKEQTYHQYTASLGLFLRDHELIDEAFKRAEASKEKVLMGGIVAALARSPEDKKELNDWLKRAATLPIEENESQVELADTFARAKQNDSAATWYRKALANADRKARVNIVIGLANVGAAADIVPFMTEQVKNQSHSFIYNTSLMIALARTRDTNLIGQFLQIRTNSALNDNERNYYRAVMAQDSGETNAANKLVSALAGTRPLTTAHIQMLDAICKQNGLNAERAKYLAQLTAGNGVVRRGHPFAELVELSANQQDSASAVKWLAKMNPVWNQPEGDRAREAIIKSISAANYAAFRDAIIKTATEAPDNDRASNLIGFCAQVSHIIGKNETATALAQAAKLSGTELAEATAWDGFITDWDVSRPFASEAEAMLLAERDEPEVHFQRVSATTTKWKPHTSTNQQTVVRLNNSETGKDSLTFCRATVKSDTDAKTVFYLGANSAVKIWVNGDLVYDHASQTENCVPDYDRFSAPLKKGANSVIVESAGKSFCLRTARL